MEMGVFYSIRLWGWIEWAVYGVSLILSYPVPVEVAVLMGNSWAHEICTYDNEERAIVIASMNEMAYVLQAWLPLIVWKQTEAPRYRKGYITITFLSASLIVTAFVIRALHAREVAKQNPDQERSAEGSLVEEEVGGKGTSGEPTRL